MKLILCVAVAFALVVVVFGHPGGLDRSGGHYNRKTGEYHVHRPVARVAVPTNPPPDVVSSNTPPVKQTNNVPLSQSFSPYRSVEQLPR